MLQAATHIGVFQPHIALRELVADTVMQARYSLRATRNLRDSFTIRSPTGNYHTGDYYPTGDYPTGSYPTVTIL